MQATTTTQQQNSFLFGWLLFGATALLVALIGTLALAKMPASIASTNARTITLTTGTMSFDQKEIRVKLGETITINMNNDSFVPHSFDVDEFDVHAGLGMQGTNSVTFTAHRVGEYKFYCGVSGHENAGMIGTLIVEK